MAKKKKAAPKKPAAKKRVKKELTPEAKEKATIKELREKALKEPVSYGVVTGINAYISEFCAKGESQAAAVQNVSEASKKWKTLTSSEHEVGHQRDDVMRQC